MGSINSRQISNREILKVLEKYIETYPDARFIQALWALNLITYEAYELGNIQDRKIEDRFYEEPSATLQKIMEKINEQLS